MIAVPDGGCTIAVLAAPEEPTALVYLAGEIDLAASEVLADVADRLSAAAPANVVVDLAAVTSACSALPDFLTRVHHNLPSGSALVLCRPTTSTRQVLTMAGLDDMATLHADLPTGDHSPPPVSGQRLGLHALQALYEHLDLRDANQSSF